MVSKLFLVGPFTTGINFGGATSVENLIVGALAIVVSELLVEKSERNIKMVQVEGGKEEKEISREEKSQVW